MEKMGMHFKVKLDVRKEKEEENNQKLYFILFNKSINWSI